MFLQDIVELIKKDDFGLDGSIEKAIIGMCSSKEDIDMIKEYYKPNKDKDYQDEEFYTDFFLDLYDKLGLDAEYIDTAKKEGFSESLIDKLISLGRLEEALLECNKYKENGSFWSAEIKKLEILKKLGRHVEFNKLLLDRVKKNGDINDAIKLKKETSEEEWKKIMNHIISDAKKKERNDFLSRIYYHENDYKSAYDYCKSIRDMNYLELLAKKLTTADPMLACQIFKRLCFVWIDSGSGWPYKKAGKMLEAIKKL
ncbi:MAG: hypothetical protein KKF44_05905, partial [Nanoarchaeota archaeon]|nr:hypothetical protein [Nanoarchaeota archaeon]